MIIEENVSKIAEKLRTPSENAQDLYDSAKKIKLMTIGNKVHVRGIIEYSNICEKNCYYCGLRKDNTNIIRYSISNNQIIKSVENAIKLGFTSVVLQSGEINHKINGKKIENIIKAIKEISDDKMGITLSLGEHSIDTYESWFNAGAHRYLLRIESSTKELYEKIHPNNENHSWNKRINCLNNLKKIGYQLGTGVMIGIPGQSIEDLARDLIFMKELDIDMCGMGPFIEQDDTPICKSKEKHFPLDERFNLTMKMIAILRLMMPNINIAATTSLQAIKENGKLEAIEKGANIIMPNITHSQYREKYKIYNDKPTNIEVTAKYLKFLEKDINKINHQMVMDEWGDSQHYIKSNPKYRKSTQKL